MTAPPTPVARLRVAATFTAEPLEPYLAKALGLFGFEADLRFAPFNQVLQSLLDPSSLLSTNAGGTNLLLVRATDFGATGPARARSVAREVAAAVGESMGHGVQRTLIVLCPSAEGADIEQTFADDLRDQIKPVAGVELIDASDAFRLYDLRDIHDAEASEAACMPYRETAFAALGMMVARRVLISLQRPFKVIAVDCDNTLWTGVCGEAGARGVVIDEGRAAFQRQLMEKRAEGYLLCLVSKNHPEDVEAVFRDHPDMVIARDAFVDGMVNWDPKSANLTRLAERLGLGLDSFLFLDDNPAEVAEVGANAPAVLALRIPEESADLPAFLQHLWILDRNEHSDDDARRADFYHDEARRLALRERTASYEQFIEGLDLRMEIVAVSEEDLSRASQLTRRTNQFNACPQPRDEATLARFCQGMRAQLVKVSDRFGDYGTVGLMCSREDGGRLWAETFLLSCRALGKGVEQRMLRHLGELAGHLGLTEVAIWFNDTGRNQPVKDFLDGIDGRWEDGMRVIDAKVAATCPLVPTAVRASGQAANTVSTPLVDPEAVATVANQLADATSVVEWAADPVRPRPEISERYAAPKAGDEEMIAAIWAEVLGLDKVGRHDRFVDLGGSSLQLVRVHAKLQRASGRRFELVRMFENPTVAAQAELVGGREEKPAAKVDADATRSDDSEALAIVGMAVRLPGASTPEELWKNLREGVDAITHFPAEELEVPGPVDDPNFVRARGLLEPEVYEGLDGGLFGIIPREAEIIDPQQRVFLELCWEAVERAGYVPDNAEAEGGRIGVYAGCYYDTYLPHHILSDPETHRRHLAEAQVGALQVEFGNDKDHLATRVAFKLNLKGPSLTVQTACSSSLVAVSHAAMALRSGQCDMALAGGVTITVPQKRGYHHEEGGMVSRDGHCRPFDADSSGTVFSNGAGVVLLKRLKDAVRDGDHIHAVVRGFGMNNDGGVKHSYAAPSVDGQADAIRRAHLDAGVDPRSISYIEAHGTATPLGDPIEITALTQAFRQATEDKGFCAVGSLKSNLGHLDTAAGVCGLIKTALSLEHGELPPVLHFQKPNPRIDFDNSPFFVNDRLRDWTSQDDTPRRAGVSSFGVGGTNAHVILEEAPRDVTPEPAEDERVWLLSGRSDEAVAELADRLTAHAESAEPSDFATAARTMALGRKAMGRRAAVVSRDWPSLAEKLRTKEFTIAEADTAEPEQVWMFPGQGAQHPGMTKDLYDAEPGYREDIDYCAELLKPLLGEDLRDTLFAEDGGEAAERLKRTVLAQPAIFVVEWALARQWARWGLEPKLMLGHSVGEFTAACLAGVFSIDDGLRILAARGRLMGELPGGSMLSVRLAASELSSRLPEGIDLAASNGPTLSVVAGATEAVDAFAKQLESEGINVRELHTSHAFHSYMMDPVVDRFREVIEEVTLHPPRMAILSTVTGRHLTKHEATDPGYWAAHLRRTVDFHGALEAAASEKEGRVYLEVGPGQTLTTLARQTAGRRAAGCVPSCEHPASGSPDRPRMLLSLGELWTRGVEIDWTRIFAEVPARRVPLPTYPFQRKRHWKECRLLDQPIVTAGAPVEVSVESVEPAAPDAPVESLVDQVRQVLEDLSGIPGSDMAEGSGFLELGFDSLLLTQAARELQKTFGVAIAFRDLMQSFPTLGKLVAHLEASGVSVAPGAKPAPVAKVEAVAPEPGADEAESGVAGPRTRIDRESRGDELTPPQRAHLDALIERYCAKTSTSKSRTQEYRQWHADPRTVNGFNRLWKEMVYQIVATRMKGCRMWDVDGNEYIDMVNGFGPNFLGHSPDFVTEAIQEQLATGLEIGPQCEAAMETSKLFCEVTGNERVCFLNTGSEAVQAAMRIARTVTGRDKILVFDKDYHGNFDPVLVRSVGKGQRRRTLPLAPGIPDNAVQDIIVVPWGRPEALDMIREVAGELAAVLVEPVQSRQPELVPVDFVHEVKKIRDEHGFLLVFDEVITGVRQGPRGAQELYGIEADLATYGKVFGGGALPIGICAGKAEYMDTFDGGQWQFGDDSFPEKEVTFFAGTFVRLPLAMAACRAVLNHVKEQSPEYWEGIGKRADRLATTVDRMFRDEGIDVRMVNFNSQMYLRIGDEAKHGNLIYYHLRSKGVFAMEGLPFYLTAAHSDADVDFVIDAFRETIAELQDGGFFPKNEKRLGMADGERGPFPMTEPMAEIWLASLLGEEANLAFNEMLQLRLTGPADLKAVRAALQDLVDRHDALRMRVPEGRTPEFVIDGHQDAVLIEVDLREEADREAAVRECGLRQRETAFDLATGPLFRVVAARVADDELVLQFVAHHLAADGWSFEVLIRDFAKAYEARLTGTKPKFTPAPSIVDRAHREDRSVEKVGGSLDWWAQHFTDGVPEVELPLRKAYPPAPIYASDTCELMLDVAMLDRLKGLSSTCGATLNSTLLAGFQALLHHLSGQRRFVMTFPTAGQMNDGDEELVGHCVNFLPLLAEIGEGGSFKDLVASASAGQLDALEHGDITYGRLLRALKLGREGGRRPLMEIIFNFEPSGDPGAFGGLDAKVETVSARYSNSTIFLNLMQSPDGLLLSSTYNRELIDPETMRAWLVAFRELLVQAAEDPARDVGEFQLLGEEARRDLENWRGTSVELTDPSVDARFRCTVEDHPDRTALKGSSGSWTYAELDDRVEAVAASLTEAGVVRGDRVAVVLPKGCEAIAATFGVLRVGACYVPIDPADPEKRRNEIIADAGVKVALSASPIEGVRVLDPAGIAGGSAAAVEVAADDPAYVMYTSGSTGTPKGVVVPQRGILRLVESGGPIEYGPETVFLHASNPAFDASTLEIFGPLLHGGRLVVLDEADTSLEGIGRKVADEGVTTLWLTAGLFELFVEEGLESLKGVRQLLAGGDILSLEHVRRAMEALPDTEIINGYGPTENTTFTTCHKVGPEDLGKEAVPIGRPIPGTTVAIVDENGRERPVGVPGELLCGGAGLALGYLGRDDLTAERFVSTGGGVMYRTGDRCRWAADGTIEFLGRIDHQVKLRGFRVELGEIESVLGRHPSVARCKVAVRGEGAGGKRLLAWVCPGNDFDVTAVQDWLAERLPAFMVPDHLVEVADMPLNANGKVVVSRLPEPGRETSESPKDRAPEGEIESRLAAIWKDLLSVAQVARDDDFFNLGGNSLGGLRMFARIQKEFGVSLPLATLLKARTIRLLSVVIESSDEKVDLGSTGHLATVQPKGGQPPLCAIHGGDGGILFYRQLAERLPQDRPFLAIESPELGRDEEIQVGAIEDTAARYIEILRAGRPDGPYLLAGYSYGGVVAFEMARQLVEAGEEVPFLALFDTVNPATDLRPYALSERVSVYWNAQSEMPLGERIRRLATRFKDGVETHFRVKVESADAKGGAAAAHTERRAVQLREAHEAAMDAYRPSCFRGTLHLFRASAVNDKFEIPDDYGWADQVDDLQIVEVPGEHLTLFEDGNVGPLAEDVAGALRSAVEPRNRGVEHP